MQLIQIHKKRQVVVTMFETRELLQNWIELEFADVAFWTSGED